MSGAEVNGGAADPGRCDALATPTGTITCNLPAGHLGRHQHVMADAVISWNDPRKDGAP
jgi:hypothetical protein